MTKTKILETTPKYWQIYQNEILPILKEKEITRKKIKFLCDIIRIFAISQIIMPYLFFWSPYFSIIIAFGFFYSIILPSYLILEVIPQINGKFLKEIKVLTVTKVLKLFDNLKWSYDTEIITKRELCNSGLSEDKRFGLNFDDEFKGTYNGVDFRIGDSRQFGAYKKSKKIRDGKFTYYEKSGLDAVLVIFKTNKVIKDNIIISEKRTWKDYLFLIILGIFIVAGVLNSIIFDLRNSDSPIEDFILGFIITLGFLSFYGVAIYLDNKNKLKHSNITLEDIEFHKKFDVKAHNQIEARYLMTPSFIEQFNDLKFAFKAQKIDCYCWKDNILFVIYTKKNLFEFANLNKPLTNTDEINNFFTELDSIYKMIDYFKSH